MTRRRGILAVTLAILFVALGVRVAYFLTLAGHPEFRTPMLDAGWFHEQGMAVAAGSWGGPESVFRAPLYPLLLGALYALTGPDPAAARLVQLLLGGLTVLLVLRLGRRLYGSAAGLLAGAMAALYGTAIYFEGELLIASILPLLAAVLLLALLRAGETGRPRDGLLAGLAIGLFAVARPNILLFAPAAAAWLLLPGVGSGRKGAVLLLAGVLLLVLPVTARNRIVAGEWIPIASQGGLNFYIGNHPESDGMHAVFPGLASWRNDDIGRVTAARLGRAPTPGDISAVWLGEALKEIADRPAAFAGGLLRKAYFLVQAYEIGNNRDLSVFRRDNPLLRLPLVGAGVLVPLALWGLLAVRARRRGRSLLVLYLLFYGLSVVLFFVCARFRMPLLPALFPPAGAALARIADDLRRRRFRPVFRAAVFLAAATAAVSIDPFRIRVAAEGQEAFHRGNVYARQGRAAEAIDAYREAARRLPNFAGVRFHLGVVLIGEGREEEGRRRLEEAFALDRSNPKIAVTLADHYARTGRDEEAEALYRRTLERDPFFPAAYVNFGGFLAERGRADEGERLLRKALELLPDDPAALLNLGKLLASGGRGAEALPILLRYAEIRPERREGWFELGNLHFREGRTADAVEMYRRATAADEADVRSRLNLSLALVRAGDLPGAVLALREVLAIDPANETALGRLRNLKEVE